MALVLVLGLRPVISSGATGSAGEMGIPLPGGTLRLGIELRTRGEAWFGYTVKGPERETNDRALLFRTKLLGEYRHSKGHRLFLEIQDSRYGLSRLGPEDFPRTCPFEDQMEIRRAFVEASLAPGSALRLKVGRQTIAYADKRIFGPGNWGNVGRYWWDAARLSFRIHGIHTDILWGQRVIREPGRLDTDHDPYHMLGVYSILGSRRNLLHLFLLERREHHPSPGETASGLSRIRTAGAWFHVPWSAGWRLQGTVALQRGHRGGDAVRSWGGNIRLRRDLPGAFRPYAAAELSIGSGDRDPTDGVSGTFDGVFGSVSGAYGRMNLFCWKNIRDFQLSAGMHPREGFHVWLDLHRFELDSRRDAWYWCSGKPRLRDPEGRHGRTLGHELDLLGRIRLAGGWELFTGAGIFRRGAFLRQDPRVQRYLFWGFVQLRYRH